jgi:hypothetical protein
VAESRTLGSGFAVSFALGFADRRSQEILAAANSLPLILVRTVVVGLPVLLLLGLLRMFRRPVRLFSVTYLLLLPRLACIRAVRPLLLLLVRGTGA